MTEAADQGNAQANREADYMCFNPLGRKTSKLEGEVRVGSFPRIYVIGNEIKLTKVARFNMAAEFREKTVKKLFIFFTVLKNGEKKLKAVKKLFIFFTVLYFLHRF
jgi:hypothetical protein